MASLAAPVNRRHTEIRQRLLQDHPSLATTQQTMGVADSLNLQGDSQCRHALWARYAAHQPADEKPAVFVEINRDGDAGGDRDGEHSQDNSTGNEAVAVHRQGQTTRAQAAFGPAYVRICPRLPCLGPKGCALTATTSVEHGSSQTSRQFGPTIPGITLQPI